MIKYIMFNFAVYKYLGYMDCAAVCLPCCVGMCFGAVDRCAPYAT